MKKVLKHFTNVPTLDGYRYVTWISPIIIIGSCYSFSNKYKLKLYIYIYIYKHIIKGINYINSLTVIKCYVVMTLNKCIY